MLWVLAVALAAGLVWLVQSLVKPTDEREAVRRTVKSAVEAVCRQDARAVMATIARDYKDNRGSDREKLELFLKALFFRYAREEIHATVHRDAAEIEPSGEGLVELELTAATTKKGGTKLASVVPTQWRRLRFEIRLRKEEGAWRIHEVKEKSPQDEPFQGSQK